jgi:hypothetical protein
MWDTTEAKLMREDEMRMRVFQFLKTRMRHMILPATLGLGLTAGCSDATIEETPTQKADSSSPGPGVPIYSIQFPPEAGPEAGPDGPSDSPNPDAPVVDAAAAVDPLPATIDGGLDGGAGETGGDLGGMTSKYMGSMPPDAGPVLRYMAQMPDSGGGAVPLYLALAPEDRGRSS